MTKNLGIKSLSLQILAPLCKPLNLLKIETGFSGIMKKSANQLKTKKKNPKI